MTLMRFCNSMRVSNTLTSLRIRLRMIRSLYVWLSQRLRIAHTGCSFRRSQGRVRIKIFVHLPLGIAPRVFRALAKASSPSRHNPVTSLCEVLALRLEKEVIDLLRDDSRQCDGLGWRPTVQETLTNSFHDFHPFEGFPIFVGS